MAAVFVACLGWGRSGTLLNGWDMLDGWSNTAAMT
jgi:protein-tyrosine phosphatase